MNKNMPMHKVALICTIIISYAIPATSQATVGGPTYIYSFKYNPANESVYFVKQDQGGKGCPPELWKISLNTGKTDVVFSCDQGFALMRPTYNDAGATAVNTAINNIVEDFKDLTPISLPKNGIGIDVNFVNSEKFTPPDDFIIRSNFTAKVIQDGTKIAEIPIVGCAADQPFVFAGYAIPGFEKKMLLLLSTKGDCYEGGYTRETLYTVGNILRLDRVTASNDWKSAGPLVPSAATLVVFERDSVKTSTTPSPDTKPVNTATTSAATPTSPEDNPYPLIPLAVVAAIGAVIGLVLGALLFRNRRGTVVL